MAIVRHGLITVVAEVKSQTKSGRLRSPIIGVWLQRIVVILMPFAKRWKRSYLGKVKTYLLALGLKILFVVTNIQSPRPSISISPVQLLVYMIQSLGYLGNSISRSIPSNSNSNVHLLNLWMCLNVILLQLRKLENGKTAGLDCIPPRLLKDAVTIMSKPLTCRYN